MTDTTRVDLLLKYVLAVAGQEEPGNREVGAIHLVKYVYLADLAYADRHIGETFTGAPWRFHHFGPWSTEVFARIKPALASVGAEERRYSSARHAEEAIRWFVDDEHLVENLDDQLPLEVSSPIKRAIRQFGADTPSLLHEVYRTRPMLRAAPGEVLDFKPDETDEESVDESGSPVITLSRKQARARADALRALRERVQQRLRAAHGSRRIAFSPPPRYDQIYAEGQQWLDTLAGESVEPGELKVVVDDAVWKSGGRRESEIP